MTRSDRLNGFSLRLSREEWGAVMDGLILERERSDSRKRTNPESCSDARSAMCLDLIQRIGTPESLAAQDAEKVAGWQPIESAPKDGKWILVWWPTVTDVPFVGYCINGQWRAATDGDSWPGMEGPTHWQPLPAPPSQDGGDR
jgi:hypothetical protein